MIYAEGLEKRYEYRKHPVGSVTQILHEAGLYAHLDSINPAVVEAKGVLGTVLHKYAAAVFLDKPRVIESVKAKMDDRMHSYRVSFDEWFKTIVDYEPHIVEKALYYRSVFAGTPDFAGFLKLRNQAADWVLLDIKNRPFLFADAYQIRAYVELVKHNDKGNELSHLTTRGVLELRPDAMAKIHYCTNHSEDWKIFLAALTLFQVRLGRKLIQWR